MSTIGFVPHIPGFRGEEKQLGHKYRKRWRRQRFQAEKVQNMKSLISQISDLGNGVKIKRPTTIKSIFWVLDIYSPGTICSAQGQVNTLYMLGQLVLRAVSRIVRANYAARSSNQRNVGYKGFELVKWVMDCFGWILDLLQKFFDS